MDWLEVAKQTPALAVIAGIFVYWSRMQADERRDAEQRLLAANEKSETRLKTVIDQQSESLKTMVEALAAGNETLGAVKTLMTMVEKDLRDNARSRKP